MGASRRVLVLLESGARGAVALSDGVALASGAGGTGAELTVLALAPTQPVVRCGTSDDALDEAVTQAAERELAQARAPLGRQDSVRVVYETLPRADVRSLAALITARDYEAVVIPRRRLLAGGHVRVRALQRLVSAGFVVAGSGVATPAPSSPARSHAGSSA